jgi:hypothetical protein
VQSPAKTVAEYLASLNPERRKEVQAVRRVIKANLQPGYREVMQYGMISYVVPLSAYPQGYLNRKDEPLPFWALASQKNYVALYASNVYVDKKVEAWFKKAYAGSGKKLDMGKSCIRFKKLDDLPLEVIGKLASMTSPEEFIAMYEKARLR